MQKLKSYGNIFSTSDFRNAFLKTIRQIIRESVRNMNLPASEALSNCNIGNRIKQYPEVISQEREPIRTRPNWDKIEDRSSRGVHYSPHIRGRDGKDERQIIERNAIGRFYNKILQIEQFKKYFCELARILESVIILAICFRSVR